MGAGSSLRIPLHGKHLPALDGLRGIAVLIVVVLHFSIMQPQGTLERIFSRTMGMGWAGVDLFFVLSGFLITGILVDTRRSKHFFRNFYIRRTLRIFPLYYGFLVLVFGVIPLLRAQPPEPGRIWIWSYLSNVLLAQAGWEGMPSHTTHLWSLAIEEQFYLLWPLIVYWTDEVQLVKVCLAAIVLSVAARLGLHLYTGSGVAGYALLPARLDPLAVGALLAVWTRMPQHAQALLRLAKPAIAVSTAAILGLAVWSAHAMPLDSYLPPLSLPVQLLGYPALSLLAGGVLVLAVAQPARSPMYRVLTSAPLLSLGRYSYAIYLLHIPLRNLTRGHFGRVGSLPTVLGSQIPAQVGVIAAGLLLTWLLALVSWHAYEKHFLALKDRWAPPAPRVAAAAPDPAVLAVESGAPVASSEG